MKIPRFTVVGENIHCTRVLKRDGMFIGKTDSGQDAVIYESGGGKKLLPIPEAFTESADWENGKVKRCAVAVWQGMYGSGADRDAGIDYLKAMAESQERADAAFLDINVDEFSMDLDERIKAMKWTAAVVQAASSLPLSIDSSNEEVMRAGLRECRRAGGRPMINSVSLERPCLIDVAAEYKAAVVVSAAGKTALPANVDERLSNLAALIPQLKAEGIDLSWMYVDPLVYTISTDSNNGRIFLDSVAAVRRDYGSEINIIGGLSNVSFGMPCRKLINQVFAYLSVERGGDGGIVDPLQINKEALEALDVECEAFMLARALLMGEDDFGMNFISAHRDGKLR